MSKTPSGDAIIGRAAELERLRALLGAFRVVTVLGPPGMGKTRLVLEHLCRMPADAPRIFLALENVDEPRALCAAVADQLGLARRPLERRREPIDILSEALARRGPLLLVLDNFERLAPSGSQALAAWLDAAPDLKCLVTSRERLRIDAEVVFELPALSVSTSNRDHEQAEAVQLFVQRVRAVQPDFSLDDTCAPIVGRLVEKLDGIPLAIELAAARIGVLGLEELEARLPSELNLLARGKRHAPARQATMRSAVQWSWDLLEPGEQTALMGCGVFRGGFELGAALAVLGDASAAPVLDLIHSLCDKSLVHATVATPHSPRFDLYATIREFAQEQLAVSSLAASARDRHARHFTAEAERRAAEVERDGNSSALSWLVAERGNVLAAHEHLLSRCQAEASTASTLSDAVTALLALEPVLMAHGPLELLVDSIPRLLAHPGAEALAPALIARALRAKSKAIQLQGSLESAQPDLERALALALASGDRALSASLHAELGVLQHRFRRAEPARRYYELALETYRELGDLRQQARTLGNLGALCHDLGDFAAARAHYRDALEQFSRLDEPRWEGIFTTNHGILEQECGRFGLARRSFERAMRRLEDAGDERLLGITRGNLGVLEHECGNFEAAQALHQQALVELRRVGDTHSEALCLGRLGAVLAMLGQPEQARSRLLAAERLLGAFSDPVVAAAVRLNHAFLDLAIDEPGKEQTLEGVRERMRAVQNPLEDGGPSAADVSDDVRSTLRILERILSDSEPLQRSLQKLSSEALLVGPEASWFRPPGGRLEDLRKYGAARRILQALIEQRRSADGRELSIDSLRDAGWPGERIDHHSGVNRVHVALADLRKRGLKPWLKRNDRGYLLESEVKVEFVDVALPGRRLLS